MRAVLRLLASPKPTHFPATRALSSGKVGGGDEWNVAWETAWLPRDGAWVTESDAVVEQPTALQQSEGDAETKAFVEEMEDNWNERRGRRTKKEGVAEVGGDLYSLERIKKDYRLRKQRIHAGLWVKEIERMEEAKLGGNGGVGSAGNEIDRLLHSASDIFDSPNDDWDNTNILSSSEFKNKPDGWETTSKTQDDSVWEMTQREEDILLQEFDRRIAYSKFQIASFIKSHIFSRRRPIDGWKYMIEVVGPNAQKGKGSVSRLPGLADPATQPFKEEKVPISGKIPSFTRER
ncbi:hypothetical protein MLD38_007430 [Melastoma candidum]|uniref:Uncharacterized protein n=1 Tax=Melastoma candidum TaxID=119954 RepID=A0ACB9RU41_9MYRT|nr:hypothetical protein MLD38_007430 [Melastoma candidum]